MAALFVLFVEILIYYKEKKEEMEIFLSFVSFVKVFVLVMSILYILKIGYDIVKVATLKEGKVELGKYGLLYLGSAISYIMAIIFA